MFLSGQYTPPCFMTSSNGGIEAEDTRNQHLVRSSFPVSANYESTRYPTEGIDRKWNFALQYEWNGTSDWSNLFSVTDAINWRRDIGGEDRIMEYCRTLAVE